MEDGDTFERGGKLFRISIEHDQFIGPPWKEFDGHGPVSDWTTRGKRPGERKLCNDGMMIRYYDYQEAIKWAKKDGWDTEPFGQGTPGERAARAVEADFNRLKAWCDGEWGYVCITVTLVDEDGEDTEHYDSVGGVESDWDEGTQITAYEIADEIISRMEKSE